ncbi:9183_t:CDS:2 [Gigaspora rosea]|nr:9183_t:CDS:2 [Gigaspora rosea]
MTKKNRKPQTAKKSSHSTGIMCEIIDSKKSDESEKGKAVDIGTPGTSENDIETVSTEDVPIIEQLKNLTTEQLPEFLVKQGLRLDETDCKILKDNQIDGERILSLTFEHFIKCGLKLGPAMRIINFIENLISEKQKKSIDEQKKSIDELNKSIDGLKRRFDDNDTFSLSSMNTQKRMKLGLKFGLFEQIHIRSFNTIETVGNRPPLFVWREDTNENGHSEEYIDYIRDSFLGAEFLTGYEVLDIHDNSQFWNSGGARGTADAIVVQSPQLARPQNIVKLVFELKKKVEDNDEHQAIGQLIASNMISPLKPVVMLTDFSSTFHFNDIHQASTFARALLVPNQVITYMSQENQKRLPLDERRSLIREFKPIYESVDDDIANLDDFIDEMGPEERASYEIKKKVRKILPLVPSRFHESVEEALRWYL